MTFQCFNNNFENFIRYFIQYLNQLFVSKASLWLYIILLYFTQFNKKNKGMKNTKHQ